MHRVQQVVKMIVYTMFLETLCVFFVFSVDEAHFLRPYSKVGFLRVACVLRLAPVVSKTVVSKQRRSFRQALVSTMMQSIYYNSITEKTKTL